MTTVRTVASHEIVRALFPRPVTERDEIAMAVGKAIDGALSRFSHEFRMGRRPSLAAMDRFSAEELDRAIEEAAVSLPPTDRARQLEEIAGVLRAFRGSELMGLPRPRSRLILIGEDAGIYAQPDYWDGRARFFEMKSYRADPVPPDVELQLRLFQLGFPECRGFLAAFDRHARPVTVHISEIPAAEAADRTELLREARHIALEAGVPKVLEYIDNPVVRYAAPV
ncbi:MAG TPA: hypothetical protein VEL82_00930 [Thermoplasmata archaeon]|nr:hypothetical protein [Thermoplasmata archaeon]